MATGTVKSMTFFTSDWHLFHKTITEKCDRPFSSLDEMHETLIREWNRRVTADDIGYFLGDVSYGDIEETIAILSCLRGRIIVVPGNHEPYHPMRSRKKKKIRWMESLLSAGIGIMWYEGELPEDSRFWLNHLPFEGDTTGEHRFPEWRPDREEVGDRVLLHGHVHELFRRTHERTLNVGVDVNGFAPISLQSICQEFGLQYRTG